MDITAIFAGIAAILTGAGGVLLVVREFRRRDHRSFQRSYDEMSDTITSLRHDVITCRRYAYEIAEQLAEHGIDPLRPRPMLESVVEDEAS